MAIPRDDTRVALRRKLGATRPPEEITQEAFEFDSKHLRRLTRLASDEMPRGRDLRDYIEDVRFTEIQSDLFVYLLPICLEIWRNDLLRVDTGWGGFVEDFYPVLADRRVFEKHLTPKQSEVVSEFMRETLLEEIDNQRGLQYDESRTRPYEWLTSFAAYGVIRPDIERLWTAWWSMDTVGRAVAGVQYISCVMYTDNENPVFPKWTPCLWEFAGHLYTNRWLQPNVDFLRRELTVSAVEAALRRAVERLTGEPEHDIAAGVEADFPLCKSVVETRCVELPNLLEKTQEPGELWEWPVSDG